MKITVSLLIAATIFLAPAISALAWGDAGHQTVGKIASLRIKPRTAQKIAQILKPGETLANIASWADTVKERMGKTDPDPDTNAFLQDIAHNEKNREWHYDDLPLNCRNYQTCTGFTPDNDIVHMLNICIRTLQGHPDPDHPLSQRNALKLLVHFLGDMHQPLHIGCGFIDVNSANGTIVIAKDPEAIRQKNFPSDNGANQLIIDNDKKKLHGFWDFDLVTSLMQATNEQTPETLGPFLKETVRTRSSWNPRGPVSTWGAQWATDSLQQSRNHTYRGLRITRQRTITVTTRDGQPVMRNGQVVTDVVYDITRPANYETLNREVVRQQLAKAGYRLAKLLDEIYKQ
ncbi:MAG: S1/P1 nuclease [Pyrinomonadaceae bacterium]